MKIAIVEDELALAKSLAQKIRNLNEHDITLFDSGEQFLFECASVAFDLVFFDIQMKQLNGIETAKQYRELDKHAIIIFLTNDPSFVFEGYEVQAQRYWMKPVEEEKLKELFVSITIPKPYVMWNVQGELTKLYEEDIYYLESDGHYVLVHLHNQILRIKANFKDICEALSKDFLTCHRSYCVNINHVFALVKEGCRLDNQEMVPVSRALKSTIQERVMKACREDILCK